MIKHLDFKTYSDGNMTRSLKKKLIVGNWKMHKTISEAQKFIEALLPNLQNNDVYLAVPFTLLLSAVESNKGKKLVIGAQNLSEHSAGAYTGEVSGRMIKDTGAEFVIVGHSERRHLFHENNVTVHAKIKQALAEKLQPLLCIGETLEQRQEGLTESILTEQIHSAFKGLTLEESAEIILAYEPVWAIGTGLAASLEIINVVHHFCRQYVLGLLGKNAAAKLRILYGGSVSSDNIGPFLESDEIDGVLVGSASLNPDSFSKIVNYQNTRSHKCCSCS